MKKIILLFLVSFSQIYAQPGTFDNDFLSTASANNTISACELQPDGKILIGGLFATYNTVSSPRIARLNSDGSLDSSFIVGTGFDSGVNVIRVQSDGKILVGGNFTSYQGLSNIRLIRLNSDGSIDTTFNSVGTGPNNVINEITIQSDGKILIGGTFVTFNGVSKNRITRLNSDGSLDTTFNTLGNGASNNVNRIVLQSDGKILVGGNFVNFNGVSKSRLVRLNSDGSIDSSFVSPTLSAQVNEIFVLNDGTILIGGNFLNIAGDTNKKHLAKLNSVGSLDLSFNSYGFNGNVNSLAVDSDGKIFASGNFTSYNGIARGRVAKLNPDASLDASFNPVGANNLIQNLNLQSDGKVILTGSFVSFNGLTKRRIVRLNGYFTSKLNPALCGTTVATLSTSVNAQFVTGVQAFRFKVTNTVTNVVTILDRPVNNLAFSSIPGITYSTQYKFEVAIKINNAWEPYFGAPCFVSSPNPISTIGAQCDTTLTAMNQWVYTTYVPNVTAYRFRVKNLSTSEEQIFTTSTYKFNFTQLASRAYNTTYSVEVSLRNTDGTFLPYNAFCNITTPDFPESSLRDSQCDYTALNNSEMIGAVIVPTATVYRFLIYNMALEYESIIDRPLNTFNLNMFTGLTPGATYSVQVSVKIGEEFGPFGKVCSLTVPGLAREQVTIDKNIVNFETVAYPNPFTENYKLNVNTSSEEVIKINVYDLIGKQVEQRQINVSDVELFEIGNNYPSGVYNVIVTQGENTQTLRVIKR